MRECIDILICAVFTARERRAHPKEKRPRIARTNDWQTIKQRSLWPEQVTYEMIRPVVLFSETPAERAKETGEARRSLYRKVEQFEEQGMVGLFKPTPKHPRRKVTLESMNEIRKLQENPELGEWRVHAALKDIGIKLSPRTCGRILALNRSLYGLKGPKKEPNAPKKMPFKTSRRHEIWTVDIRYWTVAPTWWPGLRAAYFLL